MLAINVPNVSRHTSSRSIFWIGSLTFLFLTTICCSSQAEEEQLSIWDKLEQNTEMEFIETPLPDVLEYIEDLHELKIYNDKMALGVEGINADEILVTFQASNLMLSTALDLLLNSIETNPRLAVVVMEDDPHILLTTTDVAIKILTVKTYAIPWVAYEFNLNQLLKVIETTVIPESWESAGGFGHLIVYHNALVVRQTPRAHREIERLLKMLKKTRPVEWEVHSTDNIVGGFFCGNDQQDMDEYDGKAVSVEEHTSDVRRYTPNIDMSWLQLVPPLPRLREETELQFVETPLQDALAILAELHELIIRFDDDVLDQSGKEPVSIFLSGITVETALQLILEPLELDFYFRDELIMITTAEQAQNLYTQEVISFSGPLSENQLDQLSSIITDVVQPETWQEVGGRGVIHPFNNSLVILQNQPTLREIRGLLRKLEISQQGGF